MKFTLTTLAIVCAFFIAQCQVQGDSLKHEIQSFFFDLPTNGSIVSLRETLNANPNFNEEFNKTYDKETTITGKILKNARLNPKADYNQLIVSIWASKEIGGDTVRFGWYIGYRLQDLQLATQDRDSLAARFKPLFAKFSEKTREMYHGEIEESINLETDKKVLEIILTKYERPGRHRISIVYTEIRE